MTPAIARTGGGGRAGAGLALLPMRKTYENHRFLYVFYTAAARRQLGGNSPATRRQLAGNSPATRGPDIWAPAEDLDNKNPSLVALGKNRLLHRVKVEATSVDGWMLAWQL